MAGMENTANVPAPATACARAAKPLCEPCADRCLPGKPHRDEKENGARLPQTAHLHQHVVMHPDTVAPCMSTEQPNLEHSMTVAFALTGHTATLALYSVVTTLQASLLGSWLVQSSSLHVRVSLVVYNLPGIAAPGAPSHQEPWPSHGHAVTAATWA